MQNQQPQVNLDLSKTTPVDLPSGGKIWQSGVILRRISKLYLIGLMKLVIIKVIGLLSLKRIKMLLIHI